MCRLVELSEAVGDKPVMDAERKSAWRRPI